MSAMSSMGAMNPSWLDSILITIMLAVGIYSLGRLVYTGIHRSWGDFDTDATHVLLSVALLGMLWPGSSVLADSTWACDTWAAIFAGAAVWFGLRIVIARRDELTRRRVSFLIACASMVFIELDPAYTAPGGSMASMPGMPGMAANSGTGAFRVPTLALVLAFAVTVFAVLAADRLALPVTGGRDLVTDRAALACHVAVGVVLAYMLVLMLA